MNWFDLAWKIHLKVEQVEQRVVQFFRMLPHRPRLWWNRLWIRKDEFHPSLNMDVIAMIDMSPSEKKAYINDLVRRRSIAHERDHDGA